MPCWMIATESLTSQGSTMDVVMQYKTIICTIKREEPMSFWSKSNTLRLRQPFFCTILCFFLVLSKIGRIEEMVQSSFQDRTTNFFCLQLECWPLAFHRVCVCRIRGSRGTGRVVFNRFSDVKVSSLNIVQLYVGCYMIHDIYRTTGPADWKDAACRDDNGFFLLSVLGSMSFVLYTTLLWVFLHLNSLLCS